MNTSIRIADAGCDTGRVRREQAGNLAGQISERNLAGDQAVEARVREQRQRLGQPVAPGRRCPAGRRPLAALAGSQRPAGGVGGASTAAGLEAFDAQKPGCGKANGTFAQLPEQAARAVASPERKLALALEKIRKSFQDPKFIGAIESLADKLPIMAEGVADMVKFIIDIPLTAAGLAIGAKGATSGAFTSVLGGGRAAGRAAGAAFADSGTAAGKGASAPPNSLRPGTSTGVS